MLVFVGHVISHEHYADGGALLATTRWCHAQVLNLIRSEILLIQGRTFLRSFVIGKNRKKERKTTLSTLVTLQNTAFNKQKALLPGGGFFTSGSSLKSACVSPPWCAVVATRYSVFRLAGIGR